MISRFLKMFFGSRNERLLKTYQAKIHAINALEESITALSNDDLRAKTFEFKERYAKGETLDALLPEAFAVCREASQRVLHMRHFDAQLIGGIALHTGKIAEMRTGEGKTLAATLPAYLNAIAGKGVHVITVNDYLASRDANWMGKIYRFLGLTVGVNTGQMDTDEKRSAYAADITYGTNNEFGFDYLRDNMVYQPEERTQRPLNYAIIDEVDSILIDEARTPLIISGQADNHTQLYQTINTIAPSLTIQQQHGEGENLVIVVPGDVVIDEKSHQVMLTEQGHEHAEKLLLELGILPEHSSLYDTANINLVHHLYASLRAHQLYHRDQHYVVQNDEVIIVDEFTGRLMQGRRWSEGLHQAVEAKEGVAIQRENQTLASITFQNYFRMYTKLAGMTGTADTEAHEFQEIYQLETVVIPTHRAVQRRDLDDQMFLSTQEKYAAILKDIQDCHQRGQPVLVGTTSIENSEKLSAMLTEAQLPHQVLNAKQHQREAEIIAQAGQAGVITIATNMAGRGTDIVLGGNTEKLIEAIENNDQLDEATRSAKIIACREAWAQQHQTVIEAGGLHIIGTERHESRRVDNQLRGRAGRQGDPGSSRFYLSLDDSLMRIFAGDRVRAIMQKLKLPEGEAIEHPMVNRSLESAQRKVEARNFDVRKQLLEYDDVSNEQRRIIYQQRNELLEKQHLSELSKSLRDSVLIDTLHAHIPADSVEEQWNVPALEETLANVFKLSWPLQDLLKNQPELDAATLAEHIIALGEQAIATRISELGEEAFQQFERAVILQSIDSHWRDHLTALDLLRQGIHLRGYAQKNPKQEYKREAFDLFEQLLNTVRYEATRVILSAQIHSASDVQAVEASLEMPRNIVFQHNMPSEESDILDLASSSTPITATQLKQSNISRNDQCPCHSGKKYKHCHGILK